MSDALAKRSVPPAVGALPTLVETTPGTCIVMTAPEVSVQSWVSPFRQACIKPAVQIERQRSTRAWRAQPNISTALRARKTREAGCWISLTDDVECKLRQELVSYAHLDDNWDGDGANTPSQEAVNDALTFLDGRPGDIPLPYPEEGTEGDVGVYWDIRHAHVFAEVTFEGDGTFAYFAVHGVPGTVAEKCGNDGVDAAAPWPDDMLRILRIQDPA